MSVKDSAPLDLARIPFSVYAFILGIFGLSSVGVFSSKDAAPQPTPQVIAATVAQQPAATQAAATQTVPPAGAPPAPIPAPLRPLADSLGLDAVTRESLQPTIVKFLIATIPDPDTISYASYSNLAIESILRAAQHRSYNFDRHWLPWVGNTPDDSIRNSRPRSDLPGSLLFRNGAVRLVVFLVGESPTAGIHIPAYKNAVRYIDALSSPSQIGIIGPTFSGSAESLRLANQQLNKSRDSIRLVSGSATGSSVGTNLDPYNFQSTLVPDAIIQARLSAFYRLRSYGSVAIAVLGESGTEYASDALEKKDRLNESVTQRNFTFPMQISQVREAYQSDPLLRDLGSTSTAGKPQTRTELQLKLSQASGGYDKIPDWAKDLSAKSQELVLRRVVEEVEESRPRLIELFASDIRDLLFVGGFIRMNANKARLVVFDNDVIYSSKGAAYSLEGSLSAASYPLFDKTGSGVWFSSQMGQGFYDAARILLGQPASTSEEQPIWLTVFSAGENWPVAILRQEAAKGARIGIEAIPGRLSKAGRQWFLANIFVCLLGLLSLQQWIFAKRLIWRDSGTEFAVMRNVLQGALLVLIGAFLGVNARAIQWETAWCLIMLLAGIAVVALLTRDLARSSLPAALGAILTAAAAALIPTLSDLMEPGFHTGDFFAARAMQLSNGVSPILPLIVALTVVAGAAFTQIFAAQAIRNGPRPDPELCEKFQLPGHCYDDQARCGALATNAWIAGAWSVAAIPLGRLYAIDTLECLAYSTLMMLLICALHFVIAFTFVSLLRVGVHMLSAFDSIKVAALNTPIHSLANTPGMKHWMRASETTLRQRETSIRQLNEKLPLLMDRGDINETRQQLQSLQLAAFLETLVYAARRQGYFVASSLVAMAAMFQWYPFQPATTLLNFAGIAYLVIGAVLFFLYWRLEQLKSRSPLYEADETGISWLSVLRFATTFGVPLLAMVGSLLPQYGQTAFQWLLLLANGTK